MKNIVFYFCAFLITSLLGFSQQVTTVAGYDGGGFLDGPGWQAQFNNPKGLCVDSQGSIYVADAANNRIRKIDPSTNHNVTTIAGSGVEGYADGTGTTAVFAAPEDVCIDSQGNLYVTDFWNFKIRKITPAGVVTTFAGTTPGYADGAANTAQFSYLEGICIDAQGNLFVADGGNNRIRKITPAGIVSTVAGSTSGYQDGLAINAKFEYPSGICIDANNNLFVCEAFGCKIRKISSTGFVSIIAGGIIPGNTVGFADGQGTAAKFSYPTGICIDALGNLFVADSFNDRIRKISPSGYVTTYTGSAGGYADGSLSEALFNNPNGISIDAIGNIYVAEMDNDKIRKIETNLSTTNFNLFEYSLYPNPNNGSFKINTQEIVNVEIYDTSGRIVCTKNNVSKQIDTNLGRGIYIVTITDINNKRKYEKMIIQ